MPSLPAPSPAETIQLGDWIIIYSSRQQVASDIVTEGKEIQSRYGYFRHNDMVGTPWGTKFASSNGRGFVYLLKPTPELWTLALPHRTQILYLPDIAFITSYLDIKPGSQVIEAGTGSGSFSHSLVRTVGKTGKVHSFEYHEERFGKARCVASAFCNSSNMRARELTSVHDDSPWHVPAQNRDEFALHKLDDIITIKHQNVYKDGFELEGSVDAVFLDLPAPWEALEHAKKAMRKDRQARICCFSPCIEQVIRTCSALAELGFSGGLLVFPFIFSRGATDLCTCPALLSLAARSFPPHWLTSFPDITMYETLTRTHDPAPLVAPTISSAIDRIKQVEQKKERRREGQIEEARRKREEKKRKRELEEAEKGGEGEGEGEGKKRKLEGDEEEHADDNEVEMLDTSTPVGSGADAEASPSAAPQPPAPSTSATPTSSSAPTRLSKEDREWTLKAGPYTRGHTSFLTFAVLLPLKDKPEEEAVVDGGEGEREEKVVDDREVMKETGVAR
ncbi:SPOSA6832_04589, partial [Sporobolomyces salmonicolor]